MQHTVRKQWRNPISNVNCQAPLVAQSFRRKSKHSQFVKVVHIYHWATKGMMLLMCMQTFNTCTEKPTIRNTFEKLGAKLGPTCRSSSFLFAHWAAKFRFFGSHAGHFLEFRLLQVSAPTESLGSKLPFRPIFRPGLGWTPLPATPPSIVYLNYFRIWTNIWKPSYLQEWQEALETPLVRPQWNWIITSCTMWNSASEKRDLLRGGMLHQQGYPRSILLRPRFWMSFMARSCTAFICRRNGTIFLPKVPCRCHLLAPFGNTASSRFQERKPAWEYSENQKQKKQAAFFEANVLITNRRGVVISYPREVWLYNIVAWRKSADQNQISGLHIHYLVLEK